MNVEELIEQLHHLPGNLPVLIEGYETGWDGFMSCELLAWCHIKRLKHGTANTAWRLSSSKLASLPCFLLAAGGRDDESQ
jgi:hypothetical protein